MSKILILKSYDPENIIWGYLATFKFIVLDVIVNFFDYCLFTNNITNIFHLFLLGLIGFSILFHKIYKNI